MDPSSDFAEAVNPPESLVSYDTPIFIGTDSLPRSQAGSPTKKNIEGKLEEMLNAMLPPREWVEDSGVWAQHINTGNYNYIYSLIFQAVHMTFNFLHTIRARHSNGCNFSAGEVGPEAE